MIAMLIADHPDTERRQLLREAGWQAARSTDDDWKWIECGSSGELEKIAEKGDKLDLVCLDLTMQTTEQVLAAAGRIRQTCPTAHMILVANSRISPVRYMRPSISAQSLLLKPLDMESVKEVLAESVNAYIARFKSRDDEQYFVVETRGERELIPMDRIRFYETREKKVFLNTGDREYPFYDTLDQLEERLSEKFLRCHRSYLVNKARISKVYLSRNLLVLDEGEEIPLSRSYKPQVKQFMEEGLKRGGR
jgi:DNA-binding LytR/AlgR family response regulator